MVRVFSKKTLKEYWERFPEVEQHLKTWYETVVNAEWKNPNDVKLTYSNASVLKSGRIVFNIKGNAYRLIVKFNFEKQWAFIRFVGTHAAYDKINADEV
jgi:mRNA interferase HigB